MTWYDVIAISSYLSSVQTKPEFWEHVHTQLEALLDGQGHWVRVSIFNIKSSMAHPGPSKITNLANASSMIFNALLAFPKYFGREDGRAVNWCGGTLSSYDK